jgi:hypothetical protein
VPQGGSDAGEFVVDDGTRRPLPQAVAEWSSSNSKQLGDARRVKSIVLPRGLASIGMKAFAGFAALESITIRPGIASIGMKAFADCTSLKPINIPSGCGSVDHGLSMAAPGSRR